MTVASTTSPSRTLSPSLRTVVPVVADELDGEGVGGRQDHGLLVGAEVVAAHRRDVGLGVGRPRAHRVRVLAGVVLHGGGRAAVGVALAQHGVDRAALDPVVAGADVALLVGARVVGVVGQGVALGLELGDGGLELGHRGGDVGQLDDVGLGRGGQLPELAERVADPLVLGEPVVEHRDDAPGEGDVAGLDLDAGRRGEGLDDREERVGRQHRGLVGEGVDDLGHESGSLPEMVRGAPGVRRRCSGYRTAFSPRARHHRDSAGLAGTVPASGRALGAGVIGMDLAGDVLGRGGRCW